MRRSITHDKTNRINAKLASASAPLYLDIFPTSRNTSLASCRAKTTDPTRANLQVDMRNNIIPSAPRSIIYTCIIKKSRSQKSKIPIPDYEHACNAATCLIIPTLYLWNPAIRKLKKLPTPLPNLNKAPIHTCMQSSVFKLVFHSKTNDYKILRITCTTKSCIVEVYIVLATIIGR